MAILTSKGARAPHQLKGRRNVRISRDRRGSGTDDIEELRNELLQVIENSITPIGTIISYAGVDAPKGYLLCNGQPISKIKYAELYLAIGDLYSNNETAEGFFNVPDLRETAIVGVGENTTQTIAAHDVYALGEFKDDQFQGHSHNVLGLGGEFEAIVPGRRCAEQNSSYDAATQNVISDSTNGTPRIDTTTHGKQMGLNYIIKY